MALGMTSCQSEEMMVETSSTARLVKVTASVSVDDPESRTSKPMDENGNLAFQWSENDQVVVFSEDGRRNLGVLTLSKGVGESSGEFEGMLSIENADRNVNAVYLGSAMTEGLGELMFDYNVDLSQQLGTLAAITDFDIMHDQTPVSLNADGTANLNFNIKSVLSLAHFYFHLPEGVTGEGPVTINGENFMNRATVDFATGNVLNPAEGAITVNPDWTVGAENNGEVFIACVPFDNITTTFSVTIGEKTYKASLAPRKYNVGKFFNGASAHGKDVYFSENGDWTVTYMDGETVFNTQTATSFAPSYTFTALEGPSKPAFNFLGWAEAKNGEVVYNAGDEFTLTRPQTEKTLYAVFEDAKAEDMTIIAWNNDGTDRNQTDVEHNHTWPFTFYLSNFDTPVREGYKFMGWATAADSNVAVETVVFNYPETLKNVYAIWEEDWHFTQYTLNYKGGGSDTQYYNSQCKTPWIFDCQSADFVDYTAPEGYTLLGWADEEGATVAKYTEGDKISTGGKEIQTKTIYPVLKKKSSGGSITAPVSPGTGY